MFRAKSASKFCPQTIENRLQHVNTLSNDKISITQHKRSQSSDHFQQINKYQDNLNQIAQQNINQYTPKYISRISEQLQQNFVEKYKIVSKGEIKINQLPQKPKNLRVQLRLTMQQFKQKYQLIQNNQNEFLIEKTDSLSNQIIYKDSPNNFFLKQFQFYYFKLLIKGRQSPVRIIIQDEQKNQKKNLGSFIKFYISSKTQNPTYYQCEDYGTGQQISFYEPDKKNYFPDHIPYLFICYNVSIDLNAKITVKFGSDTKTQIKKPKQNENQSKILINTNLLILKNAKRNIQELYTMSNVALDQEIKSILQKRNHVQGVDFKKLNMNQNEFKPQVLKQINILKRAQSANQFEKVKQKKLEIDEQQYQDKFNSLLQKQKKIMNNNS